jgi:hypothetical protein
VPSSCARAASPQLANHAPGEELQTSITVVASHVSHGIRTVRLSRSIKGATPEHFSFPTTPSQVELIVAVGRTPKLAYHKAHGVGRLTLLPSHDPACVCAPISRTYLAYMNQSNGFSAYNCEDEPRSDMLRHGDGTGRNLPNQACDAVTYHGGLQCCHHTYMLTDLAQEKLVHTEEVDTYYLKWRYYFQEYSPAQQQAAPATRQQRQPQPQLASTPASHKALHHWVFLIDAAVNDYEEDNAHYTQSSIGKISAHLTAANLCDAGCDGAGPGKESPSLTKNVTLYVITPHCHAPSCIREELWDADRNILLCNVTARYGDERYGPTTKVFNEKNYVALPPCIFGHQAGLREPFTLSPGTNLTATKYFNNTYRHLGQMAQWTGLATYEGDPF